MGQQLGDMSPSLCSPGVHPTPGNHPPLLTFLAGTALAKSWPLQRYEPWSWWPALVLAWIGRASLPPRRSRLCQCAVCAIQPFCVCRRSPTSVEKLSYFPLAAAPDTQTPAFIHQKPRLLSLGRMGSNENRALFMYLLSPFILGKGDGGGQCQVGELPS